MSARAPLANPSRARQAQAITPLPAIRPFFVGLRPALEASENQAQRAMDPDQLLRRLADAFICADYAATFRLALRFGAETPCLQAAQLLLISIAYLDGPSPRLAALADALIGLSQAAPWVSRLLSVVAGHAETDDLSAVDDEAQRCQLSFYLGWRALLAGNRNQAQAAFAEAASCDTDVLERELARRGGTPWPPPQHRDVERQAAKLNADVTELLLLSDLKALSDKAQEAWTLARDRLESFSGAYRQSLYNRAAADFRLGRFDEAEANVRQLLSTLNPEIGADARTFSAGQNLLGLLHIDSGRLREAEASFSEAIATIERYDLPHDARTAQMFGNLAEVYRERDDLASAAPLYERCLAYLPANEPDVALERARWLLNVAQIHIFEGDLDGAKVLLDEANIIRRSMLPAGHQDIARVDSALAALLILKGDFRRAAARLEACIQAYRNAFGEGSVAEASALNILASLEARGEATGVESRLKDAIKHVEAQRGSDHPSLVTLWTTAARLRARDADLPGAMACLDRMAASRERAFREIVGAASETEWFRFARNARRATATAIDLATFAGGDLDTAAYRHVLTTEGIVMRAQILWRDVALGRRHPEFSAEIQQLRTLRARITKLAESGPGAAGVAFHRHHLDQLTLEQTRLGASVVSRIPAFGTWTAPPEAAQLAKALPPRSALLHYVRYETPPIASEEATGDVPELRRRYAVFVVSPNVPTPKLVDLGEASELEADLEEFLRSVRSPPFDAATLDSWRAAGATMRVRLFDPLAGWLQHVDRLFVVPDGELARLSFAVIPTPGGGSLIDELEIGYCSQAADLLHFEERPSRPPAGRPIVVGDPDTDLEEADDDRRYSGSKAQPDAPERLLSAESTRGMLQSFVHFGRLSGAADEATAVSATLNVTPLLGRDALKAALLAAKSPKIFHIAAHGFFLPSGRDDFAPHPVAREVLNLDRPEQSPLLRSGIALAGANTWLSGGRLPVEAGNGLLMAEDVAHIELDATQLVVLSGCETALGASETGEGVFGLRRSFRLAGAQSVIMGLWRVADAETAAMVAHFYRVLQTRAGCASALRAAQLALRRQRSHPYYWGAYILEGHPGPIEVDTGASRSLAP